MGPWLTYFSVDGNGMRAGSQDAMVCIVRNAAMEIVYRLILVVEVGFAIVGFFLVQCSQRWCFDAVRRVVGRANGWPWIVVFSAGCLG